MKKINLAVILFGIIFFNFVALSRNLEVSLSFTPPPHNILTSNYFINSVFETAEMIESDSFIQLIKYKLIKNKWR